MASAPIRQPRGPPSDHQPTGAAGGGAQAFSPPEADADSLRRSNTFSTNRHHPSASVSSTPAATSAFHGNGNSRFKVMSRQLRSGSLSSSGDLTSGLVRKGSGRDAVRPQAVVVEDQVLEDGEGGDYTGPGQDSFAKGLSRQSSLPSRRCMFQLAIESTSLSPLSLISPSRQPGHGGHDWPRAVQARIHGSSTPPTPPYPVWRAE